MLLQHLARAFARRVFKRNIRVRFHPGSSNLRGGYILACTHASHLDPFLAGVLLPHIVLWMARIEFYKTWWSRLLLDWVGAFPVNRQGIPVSAIKTAIRLAKEGHVVGMFPEGEIKRDADSVLRRGSIKHGVCLISQRSNRPVIPCVVLGAESLLRPLAWRPSKPCRLWVICGEPIHPPAGLPRREARRVMGAQIEQAMRDLYRQLRSGKTEHSDFRSIA